jgi:hypothetical protein
VNLRRVLVSALVLSATVLSLAGCSKTTSVTAPAALNTTPPAAPSNPVGLFNADLQQDYLIWTPSSSATAVSYQVWKYGGDPTAGNTGTLVATVAAGTTFYALPSADQNVVEYYRVRALTNGGTPSAFSAAIPVQRHGAVAVGNPVDSGTDGDVTVVRIP